MRPRSLRCLAAALAVCVLLPTVAQAQVIPFRGSRGPNLSAEDSQLLFESVARLNAAEPSQVEDKALALVGARMTCISLYLI